MRIWMLSVVFVERKAVDFKDKNAGCEGGIIRKKLPSLARLNGNSAAFLSATAACISCAQVAADALLSGRTAQIAQLHSAEAASIPAKNRLGSMKNSLKKQSRNS